MIAFLFAHMPALMLVAIGCMALAFPAVFLGTERGRYILLTLAVVACVWWTSNARFSAGRAACMADQKAAAAIAQANAAKAAIVRDDTSADATEAARSSTDTRKARQAVSTARVKGYADSVADGCTASPDILRELRAKAADVRAAEAGLRDLRRPNK